MQFITSLEQLPSGPVILIAQHATCTACVPVKAAVADHPNAYLIDVHSDEGGALAAELHIRSVPMVFVVKDRVIDQVAYSSNDCLKLAKQFASN